MPDVREQWRVNSKRYYDAHKEQINEARRLARQQAKKRAEITARRKEKLLYAMLEDW